MKNFNRQETQVNRRAKIVGTGSYVPERVLSNQDLEKMVETSDEWIVSRTGMRERRIARGDEFTSDMGLAAAKKALEAAKIPAESLDLILFATLTPDYIFPSTACLIQTQLGATKAAAVDVQAACTGYLYVLGMAKAFIESGIYKNILVIAAEKLSSIVNYTDRNTCVLFGDGASAAVISLEGKGLAIREISLGSDGELAKLLILPAGGSRQPATRESVDGGLHFLQMEGKEVFKHAVRRMESASKEVIDRAGIQESEISWLIPHQANMRIIEALAKRFEVPMEKVFITIHKYGNTSASSVGIALDEMLRQNNVKKGDNILLTAFGAGLTWGASILTHE
ncbi:MAG TPA: beta-ketoacyl-ACP synthase III [Rhabdochlamydiaceae bacterium]|nr:beta-ketoacyl-ACP synthase III [Rhabdochlamydiaceae bacterium]